MSIRRGLQYDPDEDDQTIRNIQEHGTVSLDASRNRSNFQQDMDNLLYGGIPKRRSIQGSTTAKQSTKEVKKTQTTKMQKSPSSTDKKAVVQKQVDTYVQQKPKQVIKQKQTIQEQPLNIKQVDTIQIVNDIENNVFYNRPGYIRKLRKIAQNFNFEKDNTDKHRFIDVLRPKQTLRNLMKKLNFQGFQDHQFPPNSSSISYESRNQTTIQWKKPQQIFKSPVFGKYIDPNDIQPGSMSSPQFLSTLSCLAEREQNIKRLIQNQELNSNGFYFVRINVNGVWRYICVDDSLPEQSGQAIGARSFNDSQSELWISIIQKAYAKVYHGYSCFNQKNIPREHYLRDLTGVPIKKYQLNHADLNQAVTDALNNGYPIVAVPSQKITNIGFNPNYSLSIVKVTGKGFELRSSWGTVSERPKVTISKEGVFELSSGDLKEYISHILIAQTNPQFNETTIQSKHHQSFYSCYNFKLNHSNPTGVISISQFDNRLFSSAYKRTYVPFRVILQKKNVEDEESNSLFVNAKFSYKSRNLDLYVNLSPGTYYVYCIGQWNDDQIYDYNLSVFANELVSITKINHANFPNIIAEALTQLNIGSGRRSAKGNVDEYIMYHQPSNLILITALSLVDREFNHILNLQQVKSEFLSLLNAVRPEDTFGKKFRREIKEYKASVFNQKNWEIKLLPHEKYTWVFSNNQDYDLANFKNWGFK